MRLSCIFVNVYTIAYRVQYTFTRVHSRIPNGHPREEKRTCRRTSRRGSSCVSGSWQAERGSRRTRRHPRDDSRAEVGEDVRIGVGVRVGPVEFQLIDYTQIVHLITLTYIVDLDLLTSGSMHASACHVLYVYRLLSLID